MANETIHIRIIGRVQGVYYRAWTESQAKSLGLEGWVRNRRDGSVEAVFSGAAEKVELMLQRCREGPPDAVVKKIEIIQRGGAAPQGFIIRETC